jgi:hypothetical protein
VYLDIGLSLLLRMKRGDRLEGKGLGLFFCKLRLYQKISCPVAHVVYLLTVHQISSPHPKKLLGFKYIHCHKLGERLLKSKAVVLDRTLLPSQNQIDWCYLLMLPMWIDKEVNELVTILNSLRFFSAVYIEYQIRAPLRLAALRGSTCFDNVTVAFILRIGTCLCY